jgi:hypothetical protein
MTPRIELTPEARRILDDLGSAPEWVLAAIAAAAKKQNELTVDHIRQKYLFFPRSEPTTPIGLRFVTGRLQQSLWASDPVVTAGRVESAIGNNVKSHGVNYAEVHEFGAEVPAHDLKAKPGRSKTNPKHAHVLAFKIGDRVIYRHQVHIPAYSLPARAPIQRGIADRLDDYGAALSDAIVDAWNKRK